MTTIAIYHQPIGGDMHVHSDKTLCGPLLGYCAEHSVLELAYTYSRDIVGDPAAYLETIWAENNDVHGNEENVRAGKRSLSVGDVVVLSGDHDLTAAVAAVGFDTSISFAASSGRLG